MYRRGVLSALVPSLSVSVAGCNDADPVNGSDPDSEPTPDDRAEIADHELVREGAGTDEETVAIEGTVRIHEEGLQHVELRGRFFDSEGEPLDTTFERLQEIEVGTQPFEIQYPEIGPAAAAVDGYEIEITTVI